VESPDCAVTSHGFAIWRQLCQSVPCPSPHGGHTSDEQLMTEEMARSNSLGRWRTAANDL